MLRVLSNGGVVGLLVLFAACGRSHSPSSPSPTPGPKPSSATVTIAASGVSPKTVQVAIGGHVTFVNNDTRNHIIDSNPHPAHTDCPEINQVGLLSSGQTRDTATFPVERSCGYHDHGAPGDTTMQGTIVIQ